MFFVSLGLSWSTMTHVLNGCNGSIGTPLVSCMVRAQAAKSYPPRRCLSTFHDKAGSVKCARQGPRKMKTPPSPHICSNIEGGGGGEGRGEGGGAGTLKKKKRPPPKKNGLKKNRLGRVTNRRFSFFIWRSEKPPFFGAQNKKLNTTESVGWTDSI